MDKKAKPPVAKDETPKPPDKTPDFVKGTIDPPIKK